ncbi:MAG: PD-(D/E)XK nuclease-like domain-containing protein [Pseudomonadota bacterium]
MSDPTDAFVLDGSAEWTPPPWPEDCPPPGVYHIGMAAYQRIPAANASSLKLGLQYSALHMRETLGGRLHRDSAALRFGRAVHCRLLEPATFQESWPVVGPCEALLKSGARQDQPCGANGAAQDDAGHWYCGKHLPGAHTKPDDYVTPSEAASIKQMAASIYDHEVVKLLRSHGGCEVTLIWERDGLPCKARLDKLIDDPLTVVDLKTTAFGGGTGRAIKWAVSEYQYDLSAAWYCDAVKAVTGNRASFFWVFAEKESPYAVAAAPLKPAMREVGRMKTNRAWAMYLHGVKTGEWPGYGVVAVDPSDWEIKAYGLEGLV